MQVGKVYVYVCDFCQARHERVGYGLPEGMCWIAGDYRRDSPLRHICQACADQGRHADAPLRQSGSLK